MIPLKLEIARTPAQRGRGLMYRQRVAPNQGMLFVYARELPRCMWMKNTYIPLDMIFLDRYGVVVDVIENATPKSLKPRCSRYPAKYVVETNAGFVRHHGIRRGSRLQLGAPR